MKYIKCTYDVWDEALNKCNRKKSKRKKRTGGWKASKVFKRLN